MGSTGSGKTTFAVVAVAAGVIGDVLRGVLRPSPSHVVALRAFAFALPAVYVSLYLGVVVLTTGTWWTVHFLTGSIVLCGVVGLLLSFLLAPSGRVSRAA